MQYLKTYLKKITDRGNIKLAESISKTAEEVGNKHIKNFSFMNQDRMTEGIKLLASLLRENI